mgnify:CR=1 FL=1
MLIYYKDTFYSENDFLNIVEKDCMSLFASSNIQLLKWKNFIIPSDFSKFTTYDWITYTGSSVIEDD